jgi:hypothetical protein
MFQSRTDPYQTTTSSFPGTHKNVNAQGNLTSSITVKDREMRQMLMQFMEEANRRGSFQMIYPCENYHHYAKYFEKERPSDRALNDQITKLKQRLRNPSGARGGPLINSTFSKVPPPSGAYYG